MTGAIGGTCLVLERRGQCGCQPSDGIDRTPMRDLLDPESRARIVITSAARNPYAGFGGTIGSGGFRPITMGP